jgi:hypothetical protein
MLNNLSINNSEKEKGEEKIIYLVIIKIKLLKILKKKKKIIKKKF